MPTTGLGVEAAMVVLDIVEVEVIYGVGIGRKLRIEQQCDQVH